MNQKIENPAPKTPTSHLHVMNLVVALLAGIISITGGVYSLKNNIFSGPAYGSLQGVVRDQKIAKPLKLAAVEITDLSGAVVNTATTDDNGHYSIESLKTGNYAVKFTAPMHKIETKTIKVEKDLGSSINVDLVPEMPAQTNILPAEVTASAVQNIKQPYTPAAAYPAATPAAASYNASGQVTPATTAPAAYAPSNVPVQQDAFADQPYSGYPRRHTRRYAGSSDPSASGDTSSSSSAGSSLATVGTQLLSALVSKK